MWKKIILSILFIDFALLNLRALSAFSYFGVLEAVFANQATQLVFADLCISLGLVLVWMYKDARAKQRCFWPYALVTLLFGCAGPLAYLLVDAFCEAPDPLREAARMSA